METASLIMLLGIGIMFIIIGILNMKGNISSIHWYNRQKVSKENTKKYGKLMGIGLLVMGISFILTAVLQMIFNNENLYYVVVAGTIIGLVLMIYGQFKYNKGIF